MTANKVRERIAGFALCVCARARVCVCVCLLVVFCLVGALVPILLDTQEQRHCAVAEGYVLRAKNAECSARNEELAPKCVRG